MGAALAALDLNRDLYEKAAYLAGLSTDFFKDIEQPSTLWRVERRFMPTRTASRPNIP